METVETEETVGTVESVTAVKLHQNTGLKSSTLISQILQFRARFFRNCNFLFSYMEKWSRGHILTVFWKILNRGTPRKSGFFQERGRKRVKEWGDVTFMKEWVKAMDNTKILAPADLKNLVSSPRYSYLKIPRSPNQISLVYFRAS